MVASGDADALNLRHIRRRHGHLFLVVVMRPGAEDERAVTRPNRRRPLSAKRTLNQVPAKTALVLTGSAIALASYLGASSNDAGHDGRGAQHTTLAAALTASHPATAAGTINAGASGLGTGLESSGSGHTSKHGVTGSPGPLTLAAYGTARRHPRPPLRYPEHHQKHHPKHPKTPNTTRRSTRPAGTRPAGTGAGCTVTRGRSPAR